MAFRTRRLDSFGLEIMDLDLSSEIAGSDRAALYELWLEHGLLLFRDGAHSAEQQVRLAQCFGPLQIHPFERARWKENEQLIFLGSEGDSLPVHFVNDEPRRGFLYWHSDLTYVPEINKGSLLRMVVTPPHGGRTSWCDTTAAYDALSPKTKQRIETLGAVHVARSSPERAWGKVGMRIRVATPEEYDGPPPPDQHMPPVVHPLVIEHEETGRYSLLLSPLSFVKVDGLPQSEGEALFEELMEHVLQPGFCYTHDWSRGDMILWDNRRTMHYAHGYPPEETRLVIRATLADVQATGRLYEAAL